jgi:chromosome segregation ATPase
VKREAKKPNLQKEISNNNEIDNLRRELKDEKEKNKKLQDTINNLNNTINQLKQEHNTDIRIYKKELKVYVDKNEILNNQIKKLSLDNTNLKEEIKKNNTQNNSDDIVSLYKRIDDLNKKLSRYPFVLEEGEKIFSVIFTSVSQKVNYSMVCKNTDSIYKLEGELYKTFPELSETNNCFLCKGTVVNRFKKFEELKFKNGDIIIINQQED